MAENDGCLSAARLHRYASLHRQACRANGCAARHDGVPVRHHVAGGDRASGEGGHPLRLHDFARDGDSQRRSHVDPADQRGQPRHHAGAAAPLDPAPGLGAAGQRPAARGRGRCRRAARRQRCSRQAESFASASGKRHSPCR